MGKAGGALYGPGCIRSVYTFISSSSSRGREFAAWRSEPRPTQRLLKLASPTIQSTGTDGHAVSCVGLQDGGISAGLVTAAAGSTRSHATAHHRLLHQTDGRGEYGRRTKPKGYGIGYNITGWKPAPVFGKARYMGSWDGNGVNGNQKETEFQLNLKHQ